MSITTLVRSTAAVLDVHERDNQRYQLAFDWKSMLWSSRGPSARCCINMQQCMREGNR